MLVAARDFARTGRQLQVLTDAIHQGKDYSGPQSAFVGSYYEGSDDFQKALASLRKAGMPGLVSASDGKGIFKEAGCATCHTLAAAGTTSTVGANLDELKPPRASIVEAVTNGQETMPSFAGKLSGAQIQAVADFVSQHEGK